MPFTLTLRDYQCDAITEIREAFTSVRRVLYTLPTGGGKTVIFSYLSFRAVQERKRIMILVHRQELVLQASDSLATLGLPHCLIAAQNVTRQAIMWHVEAHLRSYVDQNASIAVASVQTLANRLDLLRDVDLIIIDEAHHTVSATWGKCIKAAPKANLLGVTATPERLDGKGLGNEFDILISGPGIGELIDRGYLSPPVVYAPPSDLDLSSVHTRLGDYNKKELNAAIARSTVTGCAVSHFRKLGQGRSAIAFTASRAHAKQVAESFRLAGYSARSVEGRDTPASRREAIKRLADGSLDILVSCEVISEGVDIPVVGACILLRPTQSLALFLQQVGRCLRVAPGKENALILDHAGNVLRHGHPSLARDWQLDTARKRPAVPSLRTCPKCFAVHPPAKLCPLCGFEYPLAAEKKLIPQQQEGELVPVHADFAPGVDIKNTKNLKHVTRWAKTREHFEEIAKARGYKRGWVEHMCRHRRIA